MIRLVMNGAFGRMGSRILALAADDPAFTISTAVDARADEKVADNGVCELVGRAGSQVVANLADALGDADVVIDFSWPDAILKTAEECGSAGVPLVMGTTGLPPSELETFRTLVKDIPCVFAPNMSVGVNLLFKIAAETAKALGDDYDIEITEAHHRFKKDAPSGTANRLAEVVADSLGRDLAAEARHGREGITGERTKKEIGIHALRMGDVLGEHTVNFATLGERIELTHRLQSRDALASGALRAAKFVAHAKKGLYDMQDVLGLR